MSKQINFYDIDHTVVYEKDTEYTVYFKIYPISAYDEDKPYFYSTIENGCDIQPDINKANPIITGTIKWDHCANFDFDADGSIHICEHSDFEKISKVIKKCYELAEKELGDVYLTYE